jgi:hypothetical protein
MSMTGWLICTACDDHVNAASAGIVATRQPEPSPSGWLDRVRLRRPSA